MSDGRKNRGWKPVKWILLIIFILLSPWLGSLIDIYILFPPLPDGLGHGIPVFTILLPLFAIFIAIIMLLIAAVKAIWRKVSLNGSPSAGEKHYEYIKNEEHYEYIKSFWKYSEVNEPVLTLHEIDLDAGRCGIRCMEIYRDGHVERLVNNGIHAPVPTVEAINALSRYTAYIITKQEFEDIWNSRKAMLQR